MCGIAGLWCQGPSRARNAIESVVERMACAIAHRGPDGQGVWFDQHAGIGLGHRRLAVIDLTPEGSQPMWSASGRYVTVFNGEIYNFEEMRRDLSGQAWRGHSDTEVLLAAIERWGMADAVRRTVGMYALAIFDRREHRLHLVRDRLGEKPLYYGWIGSDLVFASELKALEQYPGWPGEIDRGALTLFLRYNYVPAPHSIFRGIGKLVPGTILSFDANAPGAPGQVYTYWSAANVARAGASDRAIPDAQIVDEFDELLSTTIRRQMIADVPLGAFLSGGIDSSLVVGVMQKLSSQPVKTFTIGFHERSFDEAPHARAVAKHLGTDHTELYVSAADALAVIPKLPLIYDEPFADSSQVPTYLVAELARRHVTVSLSGDGGDELFGGYSRYFLGEDKWNALSSVPRLARLLAGTAARLAGNSRWSGALSYARRATPPRYHRFLSGYRLGKAAALFAASDRAAMYQSVMSHTDYPASFLLGGFEPAHTLAGSTQWPDLDDFIHEMMSMDLVSYLPDDILVKVDRAAMAVSLETRAPFLDHGIVEFAWQLPKRMRAARPGGKHILRVLLQRYVPKSLFERPKMGFGVPIADWLRGPLRAWADALLTGRRLEEERLFNAQAVRAVWSEHLFGDADWSAVLWNVLMFQAWHESKTVHPGAHDHAAA
ncbi:MAG: hypothetical protein JWM95_2535 [Gemmatimonadetes bacterium]|nr:hypothetical protein [Gemmatimonadota bacterium]